MDLSIIIVNYCTYQLTKQAIDSLIDTIEGISYEIIVVDNASGDDSLNRLIKDYENTSFVSFIPNNNNDGFAVANNIGFRASCGDYILLLNSDVVVGDKTIISSLNFIKKMKLLVLWDVKYYFQIILFDKACRRSFSNSSCFIL